MSCTIAEKTSIRVTLHILCTASVLLVMLVGVGVVSATTITVDDSGGADYMSIQDAINSASAGDNIIVRDGIGDVLYDYSEDVRDYYPLMEPWNEQKIIQIGVLVDLSSWLSDYGIDAKNAIEIASDDVNNYLIATNEPYRVELFIEDSQANPSEALNKTQFLYNNGVRQIIGPMSTQEFITILDFTNSSKIILASPSSTGLPQCLGTTVPKERTYSFRFTPNDLFEAKAIAKVAESLGIKAVVILYIDNPWGSGLNESVVSKLEGYNIKVNEIVKYPDSVPIDYAPYITSLENAIQGLGSQYNDSEIAVITINFGELSNILEQVPYGSVLLESTWIGGETVLGQSMPCDKANRVMLYSPIFESKGEGYEELNETFYNLYGTTPIGYSLNAYDALWVLALANVENQGFNADKVAENISLIAKDYSTGHDARSVSGNITFDEFNDRISGNYSIYAIKDCNWVNIGSWNIDTDTIDIDVDYQPTIDPVHNINKGTNYTTIQAAIDDASPGDEIQVDSCTYYEDVNVIKQLTLRGVDTGAGLPVVDAMQTGSAIMLSADGCTVDGFVVTNNSLSNISKLGSNAGIFIMSNGNIISNISSCKNKDIGIYLRNSSNNNLFNNIIFNNNFGIVLKNSSDNFIIGNKVFNNTGFRSNGSNNQPPSSTGILITGSNNIMKNNNVSNNYIGIGVINRGSTEDYLTYNNTIENNTIFNNSIPQVNGSDDTLRGGILIGGILNGTSNDTLKNNSLIDNEIGIRIKNSKDLTISENSVASSNTYGLLLINSSNSDINNNYIYGCAGNGSPGEVLGIGIIMVESSNNNNISSNDVSENWNGIFLIDSSQNILDNNTANNNIYAPAAGDVGPPNTGFYLENSSDNTFIKNTANNNNYGMFLSNSAYNTLINNTANNNTGIEGEEIYFSSTGILLTDSSQNTLSGNTASNNTFGIGLKTSSNNKLSDNNASNNFITGIPLNSSSNNTFSGNTASNNNYGIWLGYSSNNNTLSSNTISNNDYGIYLDFSSNSILYHNNLIGNTNNAYDSGNNQWDWGTTGNYYSDYTGTDSNSDGIGDTPYNISGGAGAQDQYPLMQPWNEGSSEFISIRSANALTNSTITIPVSVAYVTNISGISFDLLYNSSVAIVSSLSANESFVGSSITPNIDNVNGITSIMLTNSNLISTSAETPVINIIFDITGGSGSSTSLDLQNVKFSESNSDPYTPTVVVDGQITVGIKGDFNGNGRIDIGDAAKVAFMVAGKVPEDLNADFNGNGRVDIGDAAKIAFYLAGKVSEL